MKDAVAGFALLAAAVLGGPRGGRLGGLSGTPDQHRELGLKFVDRARFHLESSKTIPMKEDKIAHAKEAFFNAIVGNENALWSGSPDLQEESRDLLARSSARLDKLVFAVRNPMLP